MTNGKWIVILHKDEKSNIYYKNIIFSNKFLHFQVNIISALKFCHLLQELSNLFLVYVSYFFLLLLFFAFFLLMNVRMHACKIVAIIFEYIELIMN